MKLDTSVLALILSIILFFIVMSILYTCKWEGYEDKSYIINNVFNPENKEDADVNLVIVGDKPQYSNIMDKITGKTNNLKIKFYIEKLNKNYKLQIPSYNDYNFDGKGIVIAASGNRYRYVTGLYMNIYTIRKLYNSNIPVEVIYVGKKEKFNKKVYEKLLELENIKIIDLTEKLETNVPEYKLRGYRTKPLAVLASSFKEVVLMDADALSFIDPFYLFETKGYIEHGMVLFKDYVNCLKFIDKDFIDDIGIGSETYCGKTHGFEIDSSCVVVDKERAWEALFTICVINVESEAYYGHSYNNVLGDKDTWLIGSLFVDFDPYITKTDPGVLVTGEKDNMAVVLGHVQFQYVQDFNIFMHNTETILPIYYNNQAVDLLLFDGMEEWGYVDQNVKNPSMYEPWDKPYKPLTEQMIKSFHTASLGLKDIIHCIELSPPSQSRRRYNMVVGGMIN